MNESGARERATAAAAIAFTKKGFRGARMHAIAQAANMSRAGLQRLSGSKAQLFEAAVAAELARVSRAFATAPAPSEAAAWLTGLFIVAAECRLLGRVLSPVGEIAIHLAGDLSVTRIWSTIHHDRLRELVRNLAPTASPKRVAERAAVIGGCVGLIIRDSWEGRTPSLGGEREFSHLATWLVKGASQPGRSSASRIKG